MALLLLLTAGVAAVFGYVYSQIKPVPVTSEDIRVEVAQGDSVRKIAANLKAQNLIKNDDFFYYFVRTPKLFSIFFPSENVETPIILKSGIYHLTPGLNYAQIINELSSGQQEYIKVSIPEGKTISQIAAILEENNICSALDFKNCCHDPSMLKNYEILGENAEGFLFPDTYFFTLGMSASEVVSIMIQNFFSKAQTVPGLEEKTPQELYDIVILASIVEREYMVESEAPLIASVFTNRLKHNIGLYSCATIVYILTEIEGRPHPDRMNTCHT